MPAQACCAGKQKVVYNTQHLITQDNYKSIDQITSRTAEDAKPHVKPAVFSPAEETVVSKWLEGGREAVLCMAASWVWHLILGITMLSRLHLETTPFELGSQTTPGFLQNLFLLSLAIALCETMGVVSALAVVIIHLQFILDASLRAGPAVAAGLTASTTALAPMVAAAIVAGSRLCNVCVVCSLAIRLAVHVNYEVTLLSSEQVWQYAAIASITELAILFFLSGLFAAC
jgi:hypothetical protein